MDINQIIAYIFYMAITTLGAYVVKEYKAHNAQILALQQAADKRGTELLGQANYEKDKQIIVEAVYRAEQLGIEQIWDGLTKHSKVTEWVAGKTGLSEPAIFDIVKSTVGMINSTK